VKGLEDVTVKEGTDALLSVELNKPNEEVEWFKDGVKIRPDAKFRIYSTGNTYFLKVNDANPKSDPAVYSFKVKELDTKGKLSVDEKPITFESGLKDKTVVENQTVKFDIELNKPDLLSRMIWLKDGVELDFDKLKDTHELKAAGNKYTLTIKKAQFEDEGMVYDAAKDFFYFKTIFNTECTGEHKNCFRAEFKEHLNNYFDKLIEPPPYVHFFYRPIEDIKQSPFAHKILRDELL
jgi:hypothetical protein